MPPKPWNAPTPLKASVFIPERELARLKPGQSATIAVDALAGRAFPAIVKLVSPTVDAATATFKVTLEVNDPQGDLKPGMFSRVGIVFERRTDTLTIPRVALIDGCEVGFVHAVDNTLEGQGGYGSGDIETVARGWRLAVANSEQVADTCNGQQPAASRQTRPSTSPASGRPCRSRRVSHP